jgi:hypothetical protein
MGSKDRIVFFRNYFQIGFIYQNMQGPSLFILTVKTLIQFYDKSILPIAIQAISFLLED